MERRLSVILAADIAGFSRLMEQDEAATLDALKLRRETIVDPLVAQHRGRVVKDLGDGVLAEFASAVEAVACADAMQKRMTDANDRLPESPRMLFRIGVNLGDVMVEKDDLFGDGVNIAARLQTLAEPGGILISRSVHDQVEKKLALPYRDLGPVTLKNIERPVFAFAINSVSEARTMSGSGAKAMPSIAILPFTNMSGDSEQQYFSDGITEDIITELARFRQIQVTARNSSFRYRGTDIDMVRAGRELGVDYLVEGSVRRMGGRIRITVQLIEAATGHHVWAERYDQKIEELFDVQDEVVRTVVATLIGRMQADGVTVASRKPPASLTAYDLVLRADAIPFSNPAAWDEARQLYERAIAFDPGYARAYALLSNVLRLGWEENLDGYGPKLDLAYQYALKAAELDPNDSLSQRVLGAVLLNRRSFDLAEIHYRKAIALNPNSSVTLASSGVLFSYVGKAEEAVANIKEAKRLDPYYEPSWYWNALGIAHFAARQYDEAVAALNRAQARPYWLHAYAAASHALAGRMEAASHHVQEALRLRPDFTISPFVANEPYKSAAGRDHLIEGLRKAGLPE